MRETILVVDDEADVLDLVRYHLNRAGFDVDVASSGTAALLAARNAVLTPSFWTSCCPK